MKKITLLFVIAFFSIKAFSQTNNDILNLLIANKAVTQEQADSIRADAAIKQQASDANKKSFFVNAAKQIQLTGFTQIRYQNFSNQTKADAIDLRRSRLSVKGAISPYWNYNVQFEIANAPKLLDAYAEYKYADYLKVQVGNVKTPISLENNSSTDKLESIDLSQVVEALCSRSKDVIGNHNGLDLGVKVSGDLVKLKDYTLINYTVGIFNGSGINIVENNKAKDLGGRIFFQPIKGLKIGGALYRGMANITSTATSYSTTIKGTTATTKLVSTTTSVNQARNRIAAELSYDLNNFSFRAEYIKGQDGRDSKWKEVIREGYYAQVGYFIIPKKLQAVVKYDYYDTNIYNTKDVSTNYIFNLNYYFNPLTRIQAGYYLGDKSNRPFKGFSTGSPNNFGVIQVQIGF